MGSGFSKNLAIFRIFLAFFQKFQKFSQKFAKFFKIFQKFSKFLKIFENFEVRVFSHKKFLPQIRASFTHVARASYPHNFFFGTVQMTRGQRARVFSHQKLVPQIRASFTHHARASSTRRYACFTRGQYISVILTVYIEQLVELGDNICCCFGESQDTWCGVW